MHLHFLYTIVQKLLIVVSFQRMYVHNRYKCRPVLHGNVLLTTAEVHISFPSSVTDSYLLTVLEIHNHIMFQSSRGKDDIKNYYIIIIHVMLLW